MNALKKQPRPRSAALLALTLASTGATAHDLTVEECLEGGDFILHAAQSRDGGLSRDQFMGQVVADLLTILSFPPELRWFVQDTDDQQLLVDAAEAVFDQPQSPEAHRDAFLQSCFVRTRVTVR